MKNLLAQCEYYAEYQILDAPFQLLQLLGIPEATHIIGVIKDSCSEFFCYDCERCHENCECWNEYEDEEE